MRSQIMNLSQFIFQKSLKNTIPHTRFLSTQEAIDRRYHLFSLEKKRQHDKVGRIEKIAVQFKGIPNNCTLIMNKDISTPYDCARHLNQWHTVTSALALIDNTVPWDMHRPLTENCELELLSYTASDPHQVNKAFWRSCSFMLGACATVAFKDAVTVKLHSFPGPDIRSGSFIYDIDLPTLPDWQPTHQELVTLSAEFVKLSREDNPFERLEVGEELALEMFIDNEHKTKQIPNIVRSNGKVTLYRMGTHVDISKGPMISSAGQIGRVAIPSVHRLNESSDKSLKQLYRFQGVALPRGVHVNHFAFSILSERAKKLNTARSQQKYFGRDVSENAAAAAQA